MKIIKTKFGDLFIEELGNQEESDRIKIYDSQKRYLDYISIEFMDYQSEIYNQTIQEFFESYIMKIQKCNSVEQLLDIILNIKYLLITSDVEQMCHWLTSITGYEYHTENDLLSNEWINKIGNSYVLIDEKM